MERRGHKTSGLARALVLAAAAVTTGASVGAQSVKLNAPLERDFIGEVEDLRVSPDGVWAVFRANPDSETLELFSVPAKGGTPIELDVELSAGGEFEISPDSRFVYYNSFASASSGDIYRVPIDGGRREEIADRVATSEHAQNTFAFTPDETRIFYSDGEAFYSVAADGSSAPTFATDPPGTLLDKWPALSPDGSRLVFQANTAGKVELYSAPATGGPSVKLNGPLVGNGKVRYFAISPDSRRVVYVADQDTAGIQELYSIPIEGGVAPVKLNGPLTRTRYLTAGWVFSPDSRHVVYRASQDQEDVFELFSVPIDGSRAPLQLNDPLVAGGDISGFQAFAVVGASRVVYVADQEVDERYELYAVGIERQFGPTKFSHALAPGESVGTLQATRSRLVYNVFGGATPSLYSAPILRPGGAIRIAEDIDSYYQIAPDGAHVLYRSQDLYSAPIDGSTEPLRLSDLAHSSSYVAFDFVATAAGDVLYRANRDNTEVFELFGVPLDASRAPVKLCRPMDGGLVVGDVRDFQLAPRGGFGLFTVSVPGGDDYLYTLYSVRLAPGAQPVELSDDFSAPAISADGAWVVHMTRYVDGEDYRSLYTVPIDGRLQPGLLDDHTTAFALAPDGATIVFARVGPGAGLYAVPIDGSSAPVELRGPGASGAVSLFQISPDSARVVYAQLTGADLELHSVPLDAGAPPVRLDDVTAPRGSSYSFLFTPDAQHVVYRTDSLTDEVYELFRVPIDGGASPTRLSGTLAAGGDVATGFALAPDGVRVVYRADALTNDVTELFGAPTDGSASPARLVAGSVQADFQISPDGARVVGREGAHLFSAPLDGGANAVALDGVLVPGGSVSSFRISPDGVVVYRADAIVDDVHELFSVAVEGGAPPLQLTGSHVVGGEVLEGFQIDPLRSEVVFVADQLADEVFELFAAPIGRSKEARRLNDPLVQGGDVVRGYAPEPLFQIVPGGGRVVYVADQDQDTVQELYLAKMGSPLASRGPRFR